MQIVALIMTIVVAIAGGTLAGHLMKLKCLDEPPAGMLYTDEAFWEPKAGKVMTIVSLMFFWIGMHFGSEWPRI